MKSADDVAGEYADALATLDQMAADGELTAEEHGQRRAALLKERNRHIRRLGGTPPDGPPSFFESITGRFGTGKTQVKPWTVFDDRQERLDADLAAGKLSKDLHYTESRKIEDERAKAERDGRFMLGCLKVVGVLVLVAVVGIIWIAVSVNRHKDDPPSEGEQMATYQIMCQDQVKQRLKSPSTAHFTGVSTRAVRRGDVAYETTGSVDAQNSFGATVRLDFQCDTHEYSGGSTWTEVVSLEQR